MTSKPHSLEGYMALIGKDNELRVQPLHNIDEHLVWSSRGDLAISAGIDFKLYPAIREFGAIPEPWELKTISSKGSGQESSTMFKPPRTDSTSETEFASQESAKDDYHHSARRASSLSVARLVKGRTFSPASIRQYTTEVTARTVTSGQLKNGVKTLRSSNPASEGSKGKKSILEQDVSMIMRSRVIQGYGVSNVIYLL